MNLKEMCLNIRHLRNRSRHIKRLAETLESAQRDLLGAEAEIYRNTEHSDALIRLLIEIRECCGCCPYHRNVDARIDQCGEVKTSRLEDEIDLFLKYIEIYNLSGANAPPKNRKQPGTNPTASCLDDRGGE